MYVDDCLCIGHKKAIDQAILDIKSKFSIKVDGTFKDYLGCEIKFDMNKNQAWLGQPHFDTKLGSKIWTNGRPG